MSKRYIRMVWYFVALLLMIAGSGWAGEAISRLQQRAEQGQADAQYGLGFWYATGVLRDVPRDDAEAAKWFLKAAEQGHGKAQISLGTLYKTGTGVPQDYVKAYTWFEIGASRVAGADREKADEPRAWLKRQLTPAQIAAAERSAREWAQAHREGALPPSRVLLTSER